jgi:hypothetical protein
MKKVPPLLNAAQIERYLDFGEFLGKCVKLLKATPTQDNMILHAQLRVAWMSLAGF